MPVIVNPMVFLEEDSGVEMNETLVFFGTRGSFLLAIFIVFGILVMLILDVFVGLDFFPEILGCYYLFCRFYGLLFWYILCFGLFFMFFFFRFLLILLFLVLFTLPFLFFIMTLLIIIIVISYYFLHPTNPNPHIIRTERRRPTLEMNRHILTSPLGHTDTPLNLLLAQPRPLRHVRHNRNITCRTVQLVPVEYGLVEDITVVQVVQKIYIYKRVPLPIWPKEISQLRWIAGWGT